MLDNLVQRRGHASFDAALRASLETGIERGIGQGIAQGVQQGIERGIAQGTELGRRATLERQLTRRFGTLPDWARERVAAARGETLDALLDAVLDAPTLEAVFLRE